MRCEVAMKFTFEVRKVEFEFISGFGSSEDLEMMESRASTEYNEEYRKQFPRIVEAYDEREARRELALYVERETGWSVRKIEADIVHVEQ